MFYCSLQAQQPLRNIPDSLKGKSFAYLDERLYHFKKDSTLAAVYLYSYILKAKNEANYKALQKGYQNMLYQSPAKIQLRYTDSMVTTAGRIKDITALGSAYLTKGMVYYQQKNYQKALDYYLLANEQLVTSNDSYLIHKVKYNLAQIKSYLGYYHEAVALLQECVSYYQKRKPRPYLNSLHALGLSYTKMGNYGLAKTTNRQGITDCKRLKVPELLPYFELSQGITEYFLKNYGLSIDGIKKTIAPIQADGDFANEATAAFYLGKSYWALGMPETAIPYFEAVDAIFKQKNFSRKDFTELYTLLIGYYQTKNNSQRQLYYINQLLKINQLLFQDYRLMSSSVHQHYDIKNYLLAKNKVEQQLKLEKKHKGYFIGSLSFLFLIVLLLSYIQYQTKKQYQKNFEELQFKKGNPATKATVLSHSPIADMSPAIVTNLESQLEKWEKDKKFLAPEISLSKLATHFHTNTKYLSLIILHSRHKNFTSYINDLKIDYLMMRLDQDRRLQQYTHQALAEEIGFRSVQRLTSAFLARTKVPLSYYLKKIQNTNNRSS
ncbi:tetratricopeptide repeat protein [Flavobacterium sp. ST-87]|uniref:Tetratricopeptide repeat protein n=1 Tax=Flavobacterium plantiphilum TaxID=3163297 RepID=A0ABW8XPY2_9FLAO